MNNKIENMNVVNQIDMKKCSYCGNQPVTVISAAKIGFVFSSFMLRALCERHRLLWNRNKLDLLGGIINE